MGPLVTMTKRGVVVVEEAQPDVLRRQRGTAAALPLRAVGPHVVVDDELGAPVEDVDQLERAVGADQRVVRQLDHRQSAALCSDGIEFTGCGLLPHSEIVERGLPGLPVDDWG